MRDSEFINLPTQFTARKRRLGPGRGCGGLGRGGQAIRNARSAHENLGRGQAGTAVGMPITFCFLGAPIGLPIFNAEKMRVSYFASGPCCVEGDIITRGHRLCQEKRGAGILIRFCFSVHALVGCLGW